MTVLVRGAAALSCVAVLVLAGCSGGAEESKSSSEGSKDAAARESAEPSGPEDPRLQGEPLTKQQAREELCDQIVEYFPDDMVSDVSTAASDDSNSRGCSVDDVRVGKGVSVKFEATAYILSGIETLGDIDATLQSDAPMCEKVLFSADGNSDFPEIRDPTSYGERPDEYCGLVSADKEYMTGMFIENMEPIYVDMWVDAPDSAEQYDVREEIMPYIMEGVKNFHSDQ